MNYREEIQKIKYNLQIGAITHATAQLQAKPVIDSMNKKAKVLAKEHGVRYKPFKFNSLMR